MQSKTGFDAVNPAAKGISMRFLFSLPKLFRLLWRILRDPRVPIWPKFIFGLSLVYVFSPLDLIPEFLFALLGYSDDVVVVIVAGRYLLRQTPPEILAAHVSEIEGK